eukprot:gene1183-biopygen479
MGVAAAGLHGARTDGRAAAHAGAIAAAAAMAATAAASPTAARRASVSADGGTGQKESVTSTSVECTLAPRGGDVEDGVGGVGGHGSPLLRRQQLNDQPLPLYGVRGPLRPLTVRAVHGDFAGGATFRVLVTVQNGLRDHDDDDDDDDDDEEEDDEEEEDEKEQQNLIRGARSIIGILERFKEEQPMDAIHSGDPHLGDKVGSPDLPSQLWNSQ